MKILFQGDSITDAFRKPEEINPAFQLGNGYVFLVSAHLAATYPERHFELMNRGISGHRIQDLAARWREDAIDLQPDVVSLLIGVNHMICRQQGQADISDREFINSYRGLLDPLRAQNQRIKFILLEPYLLNVGEVTDEWRAGLLPLQDGVKRIAQEYGAAFVPLQKIFDDALSLAPAAHWVYDGIHATHAGFGLIARAWLNVALPLLGLEGNVTSSIL